MNCFFRHYDLEAAIQCGHKPTLVDNLIYLRSRLIHTEFQFSQRYGSISFSSTRADGADGARFKMIGYSSPVWMTDEVVMTDREEDLAWSLACQMAGYNPMGSYLPDETLAVIFPKNSIYQGKKHWRYDLIGLLTFANSTPYGHKNNKLFNLLRPCVAGPLGLLEDLKILHPDPKKVWCSEAAVMVYYAGKGFVVGNKINETVIPNPDTLHPSGCHAFLWGAGLSIN